MLRLRVDGVGRVVEALSGVKARLSNARSAWVIAGQYFRGRVLRDAFGSEADLYGERWKPLKDRTIARRRRGKTKEAPTRGEVRILQDTGLLRGSIAYNADKSGVNVGTNVKYGRAHQLGIGGKGRKMPKRPFLYESSKGLPAQDLSRLREILGRYFLTGKAR